MGSVGRPGMVSEHISVSLCPLDSLNDARGLLQSAFWGCFKSDSGWKPRGFRWSLEQWTGHVLVLECRLPGRMSYAYVPYGPEVPAEWGPDELAVFLSALGKGMKQQISSSCIFVRFDLAAGTRAKLGSPEADLWPPPPPFAPEGFAGPRAAATQSDN